MFLISAFKVSGRSNAEDQNKIVQRFYQTPAPLKAAGNSNLKKTYHQIVKTRGL
jgi:hypothetical protein